MNRFETKLVGTTGWGKNLQASSIKSNQTYNPFNHEQDWAQPSLGVVKGVVYE